MEQCIASKAASGIDLEDGGQRMMIAAPGAQIFS